MRMWDIFLKIYHGSLFVIGFGLVCLGLISLSPAASRFPLFVQIASSLLGLAAGCWMLSVAFSNIL
jgi:hypothetical protein